ncbi:MAG: Type secretion system protein [Candidatus Doudnabacteria bacterium]|nr:Type secretion system protein [Candidatus Doudnabacteria bacterium]
MKKLLVLGFFALIAAGCNSAQIPYQMPNASVSKQSQSQSKPCGSNNDLIVDQSTGLCVQLPKPQSEFTLTPPKSSLSIIKGGRKIAIPYVINPNPRDVQRMSDIKTLIFVLELYYNDHSQYPVTLKELVPKYLSVVPDAPTPADGKCSIDQNKYFYALTGTPMGSKYKLTFCLGNGVQGQPGGYIDADMGSYRLIDDLGLYP